MVSIRIEKPLQAKGSPVSINKALLVQAAAEALRFVRRVADLTVVITNDKRLRELNRRFLGVDDSTDVLAFPMEEVDPDSQAFYLGDVIISYPRAEAQAKARGVSVEDELQLLTVHGVLHLLGYDHVEEQAKKVMWAAQEEILSRLKAAGNPP